jgi:hypothetical protein
VQGINNRITNCILSAILVAIDSRVELSEHTAIVAGRGCLISRSNQSVIIAADSSNIVGSAYTVLSGAESSVLSSGYSSIFGFANNIGGSETATVLGREHTIDGSQGATVVGGRISSIDGSPFSSILGGEQNTIERSGDYSCIIGGHENTMHGGQSSVIAGGNDQTCSSTNCFVGTGYATYIDGSSDRSVIMSGIGCGITNTLSGFIGTGTTNWITGESNTNNTVLNGVSNNIYNSESAFNTIINGHQSDTAGKFNILGSAEYCRVRGEYSGIFTGFSCEIYGNNCAIVAGKDSTILGPVNTSVILAGSTNTILPVQAALSSTQTTRRLVTVPVILIAGKNALSLMAPLTQLALALLSH